MMIKMMMILMIDLALDPCSAAKARRLGSFATAADARGFNDVIEKKKFTKNQHKRIAIEIIYIQQELESLGYEFGCISSE